MRPAGRSDTESLYFTYPSFNAPDIDQRNTTTSSPVAIIGAGPIGMTAALALAKEGVKSVLFEKKNTFNDGSRAICVARSSFYILEHLGAVDPFLENALGWTKGRSFYRGKQILEFDMPDSKHDKYRPMYNIQQQFIEQYLWDAVAKSDLIETRWQSEILATHDHDQGIALSVADPNGHYTFDAAWVLACDGARSPIRKLRGHRLKGENFEGRYVIADIQMDHDYPTIRRALFDPECRRGGTVLIHKQPHNIWRIDYQLADDEDETQALKEATVRTSVAAVLKDIGYDGPWDLEWWSVYSANTLALDDYRDGRLFFVGDSAHIVPIFGVRGLNNGLADAANIGWKLGWVLNGQAAETLLDSYTPERRGATLDVFANASKSARFMTPNTHGWTLMRDAALSLALTHDFAGQLANPRQMTPFTYANSPAVLPDDPDFTQGPSIGAFLPDFKLAQGYVTDQLSQGFNLLCFDTSLANALSTAVPNLHVTYVPWSQALHDIYKADPDSAFLLRPDMHIAGRWKSANAQKIAQGFQSLLSSTGSNL